MFQQSIPNSTRRPFVGLARAGGLRAEPAHKLVMKHRSDLVAALRVHHSRNDRSDLGAIFVRGCAAFEQTYRICVIDRALDGCDEYLVTRFHHQE